MYAAGATPADSDAELSLEEVALTVHGALYPRDNLTDVWQELEAFTEQANYIWFTSEIDGSPLNPPLSTSAENGLLALNLLLFEVLGFSPREGGDAASDHASLPYLVRRGGGPAALFTMCALYAALARRLGIPLQLVQLRYPPGAPKLVDAQYLLRLPPSAKQAETYIDLLEEGRRGPTCDTLAPVPVAALAPYVTELRPENFCLQLLNELAAACASENKVAEASFWRLQSSILEGQLQLRGEDEAAGE